MHNLYLYSRKYKSPIHKHADYYYLMIYTFHPNKFITSKVYINSEYDKYENTGTCIEIIYSNWIFQCYNVADYINATYAGIKYRNQYKLAIPDFYSTIGKYMSKF